MIILQNKEYHSIAKAAQEHDLSVSALKHRIKSHGKNWPYLFDKIVPARKNIIILQGKKYTSIKAAARQNHVNPTTLKGRIKKFGPDSPLLFRHNRLRNHVLIINGKQYKSIVEASQALNMPYGTLSSRLKKYGADSDLLSLPYKELQKQINAQNNSLTVKGIKYSSLTAYCHKVNVSIKYAKQRFGKYGYNHPILDYGSHAIKLNGKYYNSIKDAAIKHHIVCGTLYNRINQWGLNDPRLFQNKQAGLARSQNNLTKHQNDALMQIHQQGLLSQTEVANKAYLSKSFLERAINYVITHPKNNYAGIQISDIVKIKSKLAIKHKTIYCFKKSVLAHIWAYRDNLSNLQVIPQCGAYYYWDNKNQKLYANQGSTNGHLKALSVHRHHKSGDTWRIKPNGKAWELNKHDIDDLFKYPNLTIDNLVTKQQIQATFNLSENQFYRKGINHILKLHKRFNISTGQMVIGYNKTDLNKIKKLLAN